MVFDAACHPFVSLPRPESLSLDLIRESVGFDPRVVDQREREPWSESDPLFLPSLYSSRA